MKNKTKKNNILFNNKKFIILFNFKIIFKVSLPDIILYFISWIVIKAYEIVEPPFVIGEIGVPVKLSERDS